MRTALNHLLRAIPSLVLLAGFPASATAYVDEAHSIIMEVAEPYAEDGFTIRADYWSGTIESAKQRLIRHQLFRGNEYWFWVATSHPDCKISIEIYDADGESITVEKKETPRCTGARVTPARTGSYYVLIKLESLSEPTLDWALVYGYR